MTATAPDLAETKRVMSRTMGTVSDYWEKMAEARNYTDAQRQAWAATFERIVGPAPLRVLDVGCGPGLFAQIWAEMGHEIVGLDYAPEMLAKARVRHERLGFCNEFVQGDAEEPPLADGSFDVVTNRAVIHMLLRPGLAIHRWYRLLKPGGKLITVNFRPGPFLVRVKGSLKQLWRYIHRGSKKHGVQLSREDMRTMMAVNRTLPFSRTVPMQVFELFAAAGFEDVEFVPDTLVRAAQQSHELPKVRKGGYLRYILVGTKPRG